MNPVNQSPNQKEKILSPLCPYIGMIQDSGTFFSYPSPGPVMETPFKPDERFLLHTVQQVESYSKITATYPTSIEVIQNTNDLIEGASLWVDTTLVIMPGQIEFSGVPKFRIILLENPTSISDLAEEHEVLADEVIYYNSLGSIEIIPSGRWLIIPIEK
jgi:hypothetical protein